MISKWLDVHNAPTNDTKALCNNKPLVTSRQSHFILGHILSFPFIFSFIIFFFATSVYTALVFFPPPGGRSSGPECSGENSHNSRRSRRLYCILRRRFMRPVFSMLTLTFAPQISKPLLWILHFSCNLSASLAWTALPFRTSILKSWCHVRSQKVVWKQTHTTRVGLIVTCSTKHHMTVLPTVS